MKLLGCTVIGCASTPEKIQLLESIGVHAFNYKMEKPLDALLRLAPNGLDIYFDRGHLAIEQVKEIEQVYEIYQANETEQVNEIEQVYEIEQIYGI